MREHEWPVRESVVAHETPSFTVGRDRVEQPDGSERDYPWIDLPPAVVIVAVHEGDVLFVEQYRPAVRESHRELPAGFVEPEDGDDGVETVPREGSERFERAAARELREETGFDPDETALIQDFALETSVMRHERGVVVAEDLTSVGRNPDENEFLSVERVPVDDAIAVARSQPANDITLEGLLLAKEDGYL